MAVAFIFRHNPADLFLEQNHHEMRRVGGSPPEPSERRSLHVWLNHLSAHCVFKVNAKARRRAAVRFTYCS